MNEFESALIDKVLEGLQELKLEMTKEVGDIKGDIKLLGQKGTTEHQSLRETVEQNILTDKERLNKHSEEIDDLKDKVVAIDEWREGLKNSLNNRVVLIGGALAVIAVVVAFLLDKI